MKIKVAATDRSDAVALASEVARKASRDLDPSQCVILQANLASVLRSLIEQGKPLAAMGSQMRAKRRLSVGAIEVVIDFSVGPAPSLIQRFMKSLGAG